MADEISPRRHQYVEHWPDWPSSAPAAHGRQHHCAAGPIRPVPDKYSLATDERRNGQTNKQKDMAAAAGGGFIERLLICTVLDLCCWNLLCDKSSEPKLWRQVHSRLDSNVWRVQDLLGRPTYRWRLEPLCRLGVARWLSGRASELRSRSRGFEARPRRCCATTLGKFFTPYCLCHQAV